MTRRHVTVALSGDAGDEAFAGYLRYQVADGSSRFGLLSRLVGKGGRTALPLVPPRHRPRVRVGLSTLARPAEDRYPAMMTHFDPEGLARLCEPEFLEAAGDVERAWRLMRPATDPPDANRYMKNDVENYLPGDILTKVDRMSMGNALEVRSPLLDYRVQEFAASLPAGLKLRMGETKWLLKQLALKRGIPASVVKRGKQGFGIPIGAWFRSDLKGWLQDLLHDPSANARGILKPSEVDRLVHEHLDGRANHGPRLWHLIMLELWHRHWIDA